MLEDQIAEFGIPVDRVAVAADTHQVVIEGILSVEAQVALLLGAGFTIGDTVRSKQFGVSGTVQRAWMDYGQVWVHVQVANPVPGGVASFKSSIVNLEKV